MPHYLSRNESGTEYQAWSLPPPRVEAKALFTMLGRNGDTKESLLKLIRVAPREQAALRECAARCHELSGHIERALRFREKVEEEFKALYRQNGGHGILAKAGVLLAEVEVGAANESPRSQQ